MPNPEPEAPPHSNGSKPARRRRPLLWLTCDFLLPLGLAIGLSLWMAADGRELNWQRAVAGPDGTWESGDTPFWQFLYHYGTAPLFVIVVLAIAGLVAGFRSIRLRRFRRVFWFLFLLAAIAPGIIANLILKEHWGRPRPREIVEFGGRHAFEAVFVRDPSSDGKSFPCGHATAGFFLVAGYFLLRRARPGLSLVVLAATLAYGSLLGFMRMIQGGHFATDVVWAGAITFLTASGLFHLLGLHRRLLDNNSIVTTRSRIPWPVKAAGGLALAGLAFGLSLATPYQARRDYIPREAGAETMFLKPSITIALGEVAVVPGDRFRITGDAWGHGLPTSKIADRWEEVIDEGSLRVKYLQRLSGYLTEIEQDLKISIPWERVIFSKFDLGPGQTRLYLPKPDVPKRIELRVNGTHLTFELEPGALLELAPESADSGEIVNRSPAADVFTDDGPRYVIVVTQWENGTLTIESASDSAEKNQEGSSRPPSHAKNDLD